MKLRELHLDDIVVIPGAIDVSGGTPVKREQSFHADDGWDLREVLPGIFSISRPEMPHAVTVGGFGYSFVPMPFDQSERERFIQVLENNPPSRAINAPSPEEEQAMAAHHTNAARVNDAAMQHQRKGKR